MGRIFAHKPTPLITFLSRTEVGVTPCQPRAHSARLVALRSRCSAIMLTWFTKASSCAQLMVTLHHTFQYVYTTHSNMFTPCIPVCLHHAFQYANSCSPTMPEAPTCFMAYPFQGHWLHSYLFDNARSSYLAWFVNVLVVTLKTTFCGCAWFVIPFFLSPSPLPKLLCFWLILVLRGYLSVAPPLVPHLFLLGMTIITNINYQGILPRYREALTSAVGHDGDCYTQLK